MDAAGFDAAAEFDAFAAAVAGPMVVVTASHRGEPAGCLVGFHGQVSIDPPRLMVCLSTANHTFRIARASTALAVHLLRADQHALAEVFGGTTGDRTDKFALVAWTAGPYDLPLLDDVPATMVGTVVATVPLGDHVGFVLEPVQVSVVGAARLLRYDDVAGLAPGHDP